MSKTVKAHKFVVQVASNIRKWIRLLAAKLGYPRLEVEDYETLAKRVEHRYGLILFHKDVKAILFGRPRPKQRFRRRIVSPAA